MSPIDEQLIDAKGDLIAGTAANTAARLAVGANTYILSALSSEATGLIWLSPADMLTVVNGLTEDTTPDTDDFLLAYDVSASGVKKVKPENLPLAARKNAIINGAFDVWQRGTTFTGVANGAFTADRWIYLKSGSAAVHDISRSTDVPTVAQAGRLFNYSILVDCTTADAAVAAGDYVLLRHKIEGFNFLPLAQRAITLSFWVKATKTGVHCVALSNSIEDRSYVAEYTVNVTDTWEKKTVTFTASPTAGTWDYTNGIGLNITFPLHVGSSYHTTAGAWQTGSFWGTSNVVNDADNTANNFRLAGVQLEPGSVATDFEQRTFQDELALCQRYYAKTFPYSTTPAQAAGFAGAVSSDFAYANAAGVIGQWDFPVRMRTSPTVTTYNPGVAAATWRNTGDSASATVTTSTTSDRQVRLQGDTDTVAGNAYQIHATASAEL